MAKSSVSPRIPVGSRKRGGQPLTTERFVVKARLVHGGRYDYSKSIYADSRIPLVIICRTHGEFEQTSNNHVYGGRGCPPCGKESRLASWRLDTAKFIERAVALHGDKWDYSETTYVDHRVPVHIICRTHGEFDQTPNHHLYAGAGCPRCGFEVHNAALRLTQAQFENAVRAIHGDKFDLSLAAYAGAMMPVNLSCRTHGPFTAIANAIMRGSGCPACCESHPERVIRGLLTDAGIEFIAQWSHVTLRDVGLLRFDFMLPEHNSLIEYDGIYHFRPVQRKGQTPEQAITVLENIKRRDAIKDRWADENGWTLHRLSRPTFIAKDLELLGLPLLDGNK